MFCCDFGVTCDCSQGSKTSHQCEEASYASCGSAGTPCDSSAPTMNVTVYGVLPSVHHGAALNVFAQECAACKRVNFRPTRSTLTSCRNGSVSKWRNCNTDDPFPHSSMTKWRHGHHLCSRTCRLYRCQGSKSFQRLHLLRCWKETPAYQNGVCLLPKLLGERVATFNLLSSMRRSLSLLRKQVV